MKENILVVDDDIVICKILEVGLSDSFNVTTSTSPIDAIRLIKDNNYSFIITDFNMPDINGFELIVWLKYNMKKSRVIVMTSFNTDDIKKLVLSIGAIKFFSKPLNVKEIKQFILDYLDSGFEGSISNLEINELIQSYLFQNKKLRLNIIDNKSDIKANIYIENDELIKIEVGNEKNEAALAKIMSIDDGIFVEDKYDKKIEKEINIPYQGLSMQAAYLKDTMFAKDIKYFKNIALVFSDSSERLKVILKKALSMQNFYLTIFENVEELESLIKLTKLDLIITDDLCIDKVTKVKEKYNKFDIALVKDNYEEDVNKSTNFKIFTLPDLLTYLKDNRSVGLSGSLKNIKFFDLLQLISSSYQTKIFEIKNFKEKLAGKVYFQKGKVVHCEYNSLVGDNALYEIISIKKGIFIEKSWSEPSQYSISQKSMNNLLIQYMKGLSSENSSFNFDEKVLLSIEEKISSELKA